jgi:hypothetical protein
MFKLSSLLAAASLALPLCAQADVYAYVGLPLTATQEPTAPNSSGTGNVTVLYDTATKALLYSIVYQLSPGATATAAHFHGAAPLGANAGVQIGLPTQPTGNAGKLIGSVTLTAAQEADLLAGKWYFNIHSSLAAGGEMRAQLVENSSSMVLPTFANGKLTLPVVLTPGLAGAASYAAELTLTNAATFSFNLTSATPFR